MTEPISSPLLEGIITHAKEEAAAILTQAEKEVQQLVESYRIKSQEARDAESRLLQSQLEEIARKEESAIRNAERKKALQQRDYLWQIVMKELYRKMENLVGTSEYERVLVLWIAEATVGLDRAEAVVSCSFKEKVTPQMLKQAEELVLASIGKKVQLKISETPLSAQGIVVSSVDGKVAYNNQLATRIGRYDRQLKELMEVDTCKAE
jgi:vacuolar-type H+-ATPase subunit E/Vma4